MIRLYDRDVRRVCRVWRVQAGSGLVFDRLTGARPSCPTVVQPPVSMPRPAPPDSPSRFSLAALPMRYVLPVGVAMAAALAVSVGACDNSSLVGNGAYGRPNVPNAPTAVASASPITGAVPLDVTFSANGSSQPQGQALSFKWTFWDGGTASGPTVARQILQAGRYRALLTVTDAEGLADTASVAVVATAPTGGGGGGGGTTFTCPALGVPAAGTYLASTCDARPLLNAPAAYFATPPSTNGEVTANLYLLDAAQVLQLKVYAVLAPGMALVPGSYALVSSSQTRSYGQFTSKGTLAERLGAALIGTVTVETVGADVVTGTIEGTYAETGTAGHPVRVRFVARRSAVAVG